MSGGRVEAIYIANGKTGSGEREQVDAAVVVAGQGLAGDRYSEARGVERATEDGRDLTLIEAEAVEGLAADTGIALAPGEHGRNVVTRGVGLNALVGRRFMVGEVECYGDRLCEPCNHLEGRTQRGLLRGLVHRGGLRTNVVNGGEIRLGDEVRALDD